MGNKSRYQYQFFHQLLFLLHIYFAINILQTVSKLHVRQIEGGNNLRL
jgi:hypothetical protein